MWKRTPKILSENKIRVWKKIPNILDKDMIRIWKRFSTLIGGGKKNIFKRSIIPTGRIRIIKKNNAVNDEDLCQCQHASCLRRHLQRLKIHLFR